MEEDTQFRNLLSIALDKWFPKGKCKERSGALMLYVAAIILHEKMDIDKIKNFIGDNEKQKSIEINDESYRNLKTRTLRNKR